MSNTAVMQCDLLDFFKNKKKKINFLVPLNSGTNFVPQFCITNFCQKKNLCTSTAVEESAVEDAETII